MRLTTSTVGLETIIGNDRAIFLNHRAFSIRNVHYPHPSFLSLYHKDFGNYAIEPTSDADMLRHLMETKGVTQAQLCRDTMISKSTISEVLAEKKPFSRRMVRKFADYFNVDVSVLAANF